MPNIDELAEALLPRILDAVKPEVENHLSTAKEGLADVVRTQVNAYSEVRDRLKKVLTLPQVMPFLEQLPGGVNGNFGNGDVRSFSPPKVPLPNGLPSKPSF